METMRTECRKEMDTSKCHHTHQLSLVKLEDALCLGTEMRKSNLGGLVTLYAFAFAFGASVKWFLATELADIGKVK